MADIDETRDRYSILSSSDRIVLRIFAGETSDLLAEVVIPRGQLPAFLSAAQTVGVKMESEGRCVATTLGLYTG